MLKFISIISLITGILFISCGDNDEFPVDNNDYYISTKYYHPSNKDNYWIYQRIHNNEIVDTFKIMNIYYNSSQSSITTYDFFNKQDSLFHLSRRNGYFWAFKEDLSDSVMMMKFPLKENDTAISENYRSLNIDGKLIDSLRICSILHNLDDYFYFTNGHKEKHTIMVESYYINKDQEVVPYPHYIYYFKFGEGLKYIEGLDENNNNIIIELIDYHIEKAIVEPW